MADMISAYRISVGKADGNSKLYVFHHEVLSNTI
jgi:hypothetical protein